MPIKGWYSDNRKTTKLSDGRRYAHIPKWFRNGRMGKNYRIDNAHEILFSEHVNGSGEQSFNGSTRWPHLEIHINFCEGEESLRYDVAQEIAKLINQLLPKEDENENKE